MQNTGLPRTLRRAALALLVLGFGIWLAGGRHVGFTKTQITEMKIDPVTELSYPEVKDGFVPGVEFPVGAFFGAVGLVGFAWFSQRRQRA